MKFASTSKSSPRLQANRRLFSAQRRGPFSGVNWTLEGSYGAAGVDVATAAIRYAEPKAGSGLFVTPYPDSQYSPYRPRTDSSSFAVS